MPHSAINMTTSSSSSAASTPRALSSRRRHSTSLTDDGQPESKEDADIEGNEIGYDDIDEAMEMDTFLPHRGRRTRREEEEYEKRNGLAEQEGGAATTSDDPLLLVKRAVPETDDPTLPALTIRAVVIGSFFAALGSAVAQVSRSLTSRPINFPCCC